VKVIVTGAAGLVGRATVSAFSAGGAATTGFDHQGLDISDERVVRHTVGSYSPDVVVNCAAWTDVDGCESDPDHARRVNVLGPELLALACRDVGALFITISTDYVFDGEKDGFYTQRDQPDPQSVYAVSKLEGERRAQNSWARTIIVRSGYIFGAGGTNFLSTFIERARRGERLKVIGDSFGTPTYAPHLAARLHRLAQIDLPGIYHVVNSGTGVSFAQFAERAFELAGLDPVLLQTVSVDSLSRAAPRPRNSRLSCLLSTAIGLEPMPLWTDALREFVAQTSTARHSQRGSAPF
jgi:dTDP-4-dehydrorhamnose reductase